LRGGRSLDRHGWLVAAARPGAPRGAVDPARARRRRNPLPVQQAPRARTRPRLGRQDRVHDDQGCDRGDERALLTARASRVAGGRRVPPGGRRSGKVPQRARPPLSPRSASGEVRADRSRPPRASGRRAAAWPARWVVEVVAQPPAATPPRRPRPRRHPRDARAVRALDPRVPPSVRPPVALVERDSVAARVGRPRRNDGGRRRGETGDDPV
jgi:hypothetical protein